MIHAPVFVLVSVAIELDPISSEWENQSPMRQSPYKMSNHSLAATDVTCATGECHNYNPKSHRRCNNMSCMNLSGYVGHATIFS